MESKNWYAIYGSQILKRRRIKTYLKKYNRLGISFTNSPVRILDVCCGTGEFTNLIAEKYSDSVTVGLDIFIPPDILKQHKNLFFVRANTVNISTPDNSFDCLFCVHSLHHLGEIGEWNTILLEFKRVLKPGGKLFIIDHYPSLWLSIAFGLIKSPLGRAVSWMREFQKQLVDEKRILKYWLTNWKTFFSLAKINGFSSIRYKKGLFFFYATFEKQHDHL